MTGRRRTFMSLRLRLFPLNAVLFPGALLNLHVFEARYKQMVNECMASGEGFGVVLIREGQEAGDPSVEPHEVGSIAEIVELTPLPFDRYYLSTVGRRRFRIVEVVSREPYLTVEAEVLAEDAVDEAAVKGLVEDVRELYLEYLEFMGELTGERPETDLPDGAEEFSFIIADALQVGDRLKQRLLEADGTQQRLTAEAAFLRRLIPQLKKLVERRRTELEAREGAQSDEDRERQEGYFGCYFSKN